MGGAERSHVRVCFFTLVATSVHALIEMPKNYQCDPR